MEAAVEVVLERSWQVHLPNRRSECGGRVYLSA